MSDLPLWVITEQLEQIAGQLKQIVENTKPPEKEPSQTAQRFDALAGNTASFADQLDYILNKDYDMFTKFQNLRNLVAEARTLASSYAEEADKHK